SVAALVVLGCEGGVDSPAAPPSYGYLNRPFHGPLPGLGDGITNAEIFQICKYGSSGSFAYSVTDNATNVTTNSTLNINANECWNVAEKGGTGPGTTVSVTETGSQAGFAFDHAVVEVTNGLPEHIA